MPTKRQKYHSLVNQGVNPYEAAVKAGYAPHRTTVARLIASDPPPSPLQAALKLLPQDLQDYYTGSKEAQRLIELWPDDPTGYPGLEALRVDLECQREFELHGKEAERVLSDKFRAIALEKGYE